MVTGDVETATDVLEVLLDVLEGLAIDARGKMKKPGLQKYSEELSAL